MVPPLDDNPEQLKQVVSQLASFAPSVQNELARIIDAVSKLTSELNNSKIDSQAFQASVGVEFKSIEKSITLFNKILYEGGERQDSILTQLTKLSEKLNYLNQEMDEVKIKIEKDLTEFRGDIKAVKIVADKQDNTLSLSDNKTKIILAIIALIPTIIGSVAIFQGEQNNQNIRQVEQQQTDQAE